MASMTQSRVEKSIKMPLILILYRNIYQLMVHIQLKKYLISSREEYE